MPLVPRNPHFVKKAFHPREIFQKTSPHRIKGFRLCLVILNRSRCIAFRQSVTIEASSETGLFNSGGAVSSPLKFPGKRLFRKITPMLVQQAGDIALPQIGFTVRNRKQETTAFAQETAGRLEKNLRGRHVLQNGIGNNNVEPSSDFLTGEKVPHYRNTILLPASLPLWPWLHSKDIGTSLLQKGEEIAGSAANLQDTLALQIASDRIKEEPEKILGVPTSDPRIIHGPGDE